MRHRKAKITLDRTSAQRRPLLRNLAISLIVNEKITTTAAKGKAARSLVERLITIGKQKGLHQRREILRRLNNAPAAAKVVDQLGPRFQTRTGGYTRITKLTPRQGDGAEQVVVELIA